MLLIHIRWQRGESFSQHGVIQCNRLINILIEIFYSAAATSGPCETQQLEPHGHGAVGETLTHNANANVQILSFDC